MEFVTIIHGRAAPDKIEAVRKACLVLLRDGSNDPGALRFEMFQYEDDPALFMVFAIWKSKEDHARFVKSEGETKFHNALPEGAWIESPSRRNLVRL